MESSLGTLINLLHRCPDAGIATLSTSVLGYPFASAVQFVPDEHQRPIFLMAREALHSQDLSKDARSSFVVHRTLPGGDMARATLVGAIRPIDPEPLLIGRYFRYHPDAESFLRTGDFRFHRMEAVKIHVVSGRNQAGWLMPDRFAAAPWLPLAFERDVLNSLEAPPAMSVLGVDCLGIDLQAARGRQRFSFAGPVAAAGKVLGIAQELLNRLRR
jgi:heme iron utilization protein